MLIVGGLLQLSGSCIAQLKSKATPSRQPSVNVSETSSHDSSTNTTTAERGPRIKHVCRRAAVVLGEQATFPLVQLHSQSSPEINLSALPSYEKRHVVQQSAEGLLI